MMRMLPSYIPSPPRGVWYLGPLPVRAYAVCVITGIIVALLIGDRRLTARGGERGMTYDIALWAVPFGLIGGRLYHLATDWRTYFGDGGAGLAAALRIWDGGLGIWGAVTLGVMGAWIGCRRCGIPLPVLLDAVAPGVVLAQAIGRLETTSIKSSTAGKPLCRGVWRSSTAGTLRIRRPEFAGRRLDGSGGVRRAANVPLRIDLECFGIRRIDLH